MPTPVPKKFHLDKRAGRLLDESGADDDLLTSAQVADWFGVSEVWLAKGRAENYGPKYVWMSEKVLRYTRGACRQYLKSRTVSCTADYATKRKTKAA